MKPVRGGSSRSLTGGFGASWGSRARAVMAMTVTSRAKLTSMIMIDLALISNLPDRR
jgi:hypothetical protein